MCGVLVKASLCAGDFTVVGHVEDQLQMQHDMQAASAGILALKNRLLSIQNFASFDVNLQQHFVLISHQ